MAKKKVKIVVDADVLIHFAKGGVLSFLPSIFTEYQYVILSNVYDEVRSIQTQPKVPRKVDLWQVVWKLLTTEKNLYLYGSLGFIN
jgi:hypothetical protein